MTELAREDVDELIAEARLEAKRRVRSQLTDALTEAMLKEVGGSATRPPAPQPAPATPKETAPPPPSAGTATGLYIYCVGPEHTEVPEGLRGVDPQHPLMLIRHEHLAAVVSAVSLADFEEERLREHLQDMEWLERTARTHEDVLEAVGGEVTVIPMRLCSVYRDQEGVEEMLTREAEGLEAALRHLAGKSEWGVKAFVAAPTELIDPTEPTESEKAESGTGYMRQRKEERDQRREGDEQLYEACTLIHERLSAVVAEALTSPPQRPEVTGRGEMLLNGVYLVENGQRDEFLTLVDDLQAEYFAAGLELEATGPWPAYNFVPGTIGAAW